ncbi:hypothetical protein [Streptomyces sp. NBC_00057]|uniref:hypothetical protein n=1 Tax=Streptomyces sp. NBC_00057 TaxID=2975634 RepID=UPI00324AFFF5
MSELLNQAAQLGPYLATALASFGQSVLAAAQDRAADGIVERGRALLGRALDRTPDTAEADTIRALPPAEHTALATALAEWYDAPDGDRSAASLTEHIERIARAATPSTTVNIGTGGTGGGAGIGQIIGNVQFGTARGGNDRP